MVIFNFQKIFRLEMVLEVRLGLALQKEKKTSETKILEVSRVYRALLLFVNKNHHEESLVSMRFVVCACMVVDVDNGN